MVIEKAWIPGMMTVLPEPDSFDEASSVMAAKRKMDLSLCERTMLRGNSQSASAFSSFALLSQMRSQVDCVHKPSSSMSKDAIKR